MNLKDGQALAASADDIDTRLSEEQKAAARRTTAVWSRRNGIDPQEACDIMKMLGIHTSQTENERVPDEPLLIAGGRP